MPRLRFLLVPVTRLLKRRVVTKVGRRQDRDRPHLPMGDQMLERTTRTIKGEERPAVRWGPDGKAYVCEPDGDCAAAAAKAVAWARDNGVSDDELARGATLLNPQARTGPGVRPEARRRRMTGR